MGSPSETAALRLGLHRTTLVRNREGFSDMATMTRADLREAALYTVHMHHAARLGRLEGLTYG